VKRIFEVAAAVTMTALLAACASPDSGEIIATWQKPSQPTPSIDVGNFSLPVPAHTYTDLTSPDRQTVDFDANLRVPGMTDPPAGSGYARYFNQTVKWSSCDSGKQCATVLAPLDWNNPDGVAITLAMKRIPATTTLADSSSPDLFINPGGPGGSAMDYVDAFNTTGLTGFNIVGMDPRGSGNSTPVVCGTTAQLDTYFGLQMAPTNDTEKQALIDGTKQFADQCRQNSGALLDHVTTIETVYDFDMVRQLLGDAKFNWMGTSYGTFIGAVYLELYPQNAGRMILDAAVNITENASVSQSDGFDLALGEYAKWAAGKGYGGNTADAVMQQITDFTVSLENNPISVGKRQLTQSLFVQGLALFMYSGTQAYASLANVLQATMGGNGSYMLSAADAMNERTDSGYGSLATAFPAIACADEADSGIDASFAQWQTDQTTAPYFGRFMGPSTVCELWTAKPAPQIDFSGAGDPPFLVLGGTGDNATPYQYAQWMVQQMPAGVLVTRDGVGHGSYDSGSSCIDKIVRDFLSNDVIPAANTTCQMG